MIRILAALAGLVFAGVALLSFVFGAMAFFTEEQVHTAEHEPPKALKTSENFSTRNSRLQTGRTSTACENGFSAATMSAEYCRRASH